jgi:purine-nucleoside phosphorylase
MFRMSNRHSLLLAAFPPELAGLDQNPPAGWRTACTGVGAIAAAVATARLLAGECPRQVLFVGTCGGYDERLPVGSLLRVPEVLALSLDELDGRAYRPEIEVRRWPATLAMEPPLPFPAFSVAVPPGITRSAEGARRLGTVAAAEHLELSGVYAACHAAGVPCGAALAVANRVGPEAHLEWRANHEAVSRKLIAALREAGVFAQD